MNYKIIDIKLSETGILTAIVMYKGFRCDVCLYAAHGCASWDSAGEYIPYEVKKSVVENLKSMDIFQEAMKNHPMAGITNGCPKKEGN